MNIIMNIMRKRPFWNRTEAGFRHGRGGFALPEVICAVIILSLSILASFSAMGYALTVTSEGRNRMNDFSLVLSHGVAFNIWAEDYANRTMPSGAEIRETSRRARFDLTTDDGRSYSASGGGKLWLDVTMLETSFDKEAGKKRILSSPIFIIFSRAFTADVPENTPISN
jgi:hypothetical protein